MTRIKNWIIHAALGICLVLAGIGVALSVPQFPITAAALSIDDIDISEDDYITTWECPSCGKNTCRFYYRSSSCERTGIEVSACTNTACNYRDVNEYPPTGHDIINEYVFAMPTCTEPGAYFGECRQCGAKDLFVREIAATGHTPGAAATCKTAQTCTVCGAELAARLGHDWGEPYIYTEPDCVSSGAVYRDCKRCGQTGAYGSIEPLGHAYGSYAQTQAPTCTEAGIETAECSRCGDVVTQEIAALGHDPVMDNAVNPTCTTTGLQPGTHCDRCGYVIQVQTEIPALGHAYGPYTTTTAPTCTDTGEDTATCTRCGDVVTREIPATGHTPGAAATCTTAQTCTVCGVELAPMLGHTFGPDATCTEPQVCTVCGAVITPASGHIPGPEATCTEPQTCTVCGIELAAAKGHTAGPEATCTDAQTCTVCDAELAAALGHDPVIDAAVSATCTTTGLTEGAHCDRCGFELVGQTVTPALGHFLLAAEDSRVSCTDAGTLTRKCDRCDYTEVKDVEGGTHSYRPGEVLREPTCSMAGEQEIVCVFCGYTDTAELPKAEHKLITTDPVPATCTESGMTGGVLCARCGEEIVLREEIPATGHALIHVSAVEATETEDGMIEHWRCESCGKIYADEAGTEEISEDELRIPALDGEPAEDEGGMDTLTIVLIAVAAAVVLAGGTAAVIVAVKRRKTGNGAPAAKAKQRPKRK